MSVHKNKNNNTWYVKYKNKTIRGFKTKREASLHESKLKLSLFDNTSKAYYNDVANHYLETLKQDTSYGNYDKCRTIFKNIIFPNIQNKKICDIKEIECRNFRNYVSSLDYSTVYKNFILNKYKAVFKHAIIYFDLLKDPSRVITPLKVTFDEQLKKKEREKSIWSVEDFNKFISYVDNDIYKHLYIILFYTGMRQGEALALTWKDYDGVYLYINKALSNKTNKGTYIIKDPKNASSIRKIALGKTISNVLDEFKKNEMDICGFTEDWFIFGRTKPLPHTNIWRYLKVGAEKANVKHITIHQFRHSHASYLIGNNMNIVSVSKRLGHSNINMTLETYTHLYDNVDSELLDFIDMSSQSLLNK